MYIKKIIIICEYCPRLITQNKQTKMRIMRMLALLNVAKSEVYLQEYKLSLARDLVLSKWIISTMLEKSNGPFSRSTTCTTHYSPKKTNPTDQKCIWNEKKLGRAAQIQKLWRTVHCLSMWDSLVKNWHATSLQKWGWSSYYRMGVTAFFFVF